MGHTPQLNERSAFSDLKSHAGRLASQRVADLFEGNAQRATDFVARGAGLELDYSRQLLDAPALDALLALAEEADLHRGQAGPAQPAARDRCTLRAGGFLSRGGRDPGVDEVLGDAHQCG